MKRQQTSKPRTMMVWGALDRGGNGIDSHASVHHGDVLTIAAQTVVAVPPTTTIMSTVRTMLNHEFRRIPITDAGTQQLRGLIVCRDIVDFLCGGPRHNLVTNRFGGNILAAVNEEIREIMETDVPYLYTNSSITDALNMMKEEGVGCLPILDTDERVTAIVTEQDFMRLIADVKIGVDLTDYMSTDVTTVEPDVDIGTAGKLMVDNGFRRLPVVKNEILLGIITAFDILRFLGSGEALTKGAGDIEDALKVPIKLLIKRDVVWTTSDQDLGEAARMMITNGVGSLPIIDDGVLTGILTENDIVWALTTLK
ncbi:MAG: CBS domain-containing protein [Methanosarcinales archaeon]|nr:CBS domain-containing protein [Methanosarcinales archaeon]